MVSTPAAHSLKTEFTLAHAGETVARERTRQDAFDKTMDENKLADDVLTRDQVSRTVSNARLEQSIQSAITKKRKQAMDDAMLLMTLDDIRRQIADLESDLEARYGEHFAEDLLADLVEQGLVDQDQYQAILSIQDQDERRQAIAALIQEGIDEGRISEADLADHEWAEDWLTLREQEQLKMKQEALEYEQGKRDFEDLNNNAAREGKKLLGNDASQNERLDDAQQSTAQVKMDEVGSFGISPTGLSI